MKYFHVAMFALLLIGWWTIFAGGASAGVIYEDAKVTAGDGASGDYLGYSVALDGNIAILGALNDDDNGNNSGSAYVFTKSGDAWSEQQKLQPSDPVAGDKFGSCIGLDGSTAIIGAYYKNGNAGAAYVFAESGGTWSQQQKLTTPTGAKYFGSHCALEGVSALITAHGTTVTSQHAGAVYVFSNDGSSWSESQKLSAGDLSANAFFGGSLGRDGSKAVIGAYGVGSNAGAAYVFAESAGTWSEQQKFQASDAAASDNFGAASDLFGNTVIVGAYGDDNDNGVDAGSAYIFAYDGSNWTEQAKLVASDGAASAYFGCSVGLVSEDLAVVGGRGPADSRPGAVYLFQRSDSTWTEIAKMAASDGVTGDLLGYRLTTDGTTVLASAPASHPITGEGAGYFFDSTAIPIPDRPGDIDHNGLVNAADAAILAANWLATGADWSMGDFNEDHIVNDKDATLMATNWTGGAASVPEPSMTLMLFTLALLSAVAILRRR